MTPPKVGQVSEGILVKFSFQNSSKIYQVSVLVGERRWLRNSWKKSQNSRNSDRKNRWLHLKSGKWAKEFPMHIRASKPSLPLYSFMLSCKVNQFPSSITEKKEWYVFCYQNCSDLLWEKIVLVIEKNFWNSRQKAKNLQEQWKVRTIFGNRMLF